jgi:GNAT superfamily N-acetyltransferase
MYYKRTTGTDADFLYLIHQLDKELWINYPTIQQRYVDMNLINDDALVIVCYKNGKAIGCGCVRKTENEKTAELKRMYVDNYERGKGIGKGILHELEKWAKEDRKDSMILETGIKQIEAISMYKKSGFRIIENYGKYAGNDHSICMRKEL